MKRLSAILTLPLVIALLPGSGQAGSNANAKIALHLLSPTAKNACTRAGVTPNCAGIITTGGLYPQTYYAYLLVTDGNAAAGIASIECGIYTSSPAIHVFDWHLCADMELQSSGWPASGGVNAIVWNSATNCQRFEPGGAGTGVVASAGYFYMTAYGSGTLRTGGRPADGFGTVTDCSGEVDYLQDTDSYPMKFGYAGFGGWTGYNPCGLRPYGPCLIDGDSTVVEATSNHTYMEHVEPGDQGMPWEHVDWWVTGNATIVGSRHGREVVVSAGASGTFTLQYEASMPHVGTSCEKTVLVQSSVPARSMTWGAIKVLYH